METSRITESSIRASYITDNSHFIQVRDLFNKALGAKVRKDGSPEVEKCLRDCRDEESRLKFFENYFKWIPVKQEIVERLDKDESVSDNLREEGNVRFRNGNLLEALRCYNLAICFAPSDSHAICLGYSNRSALFLKIGEWQSCLNDIDRVRSHSKFQKDVSQDVKNKLKLRETKCKEMTEASARQDATEWKGKTLQMNVKKVLSLNNTNLKGATESVKMEITEKSGRKLVATSKISTGSLILCDPPYFLIPERLLTWETEFCSTCLCPLLGGIPHPITTFPLFCNEKCLTSWKMIPHSILTYLHQTTQLRELILPLTIVYNELSNNSSNTSDLSLNLESNQYDPASFKSTYNLISHRQEYKINSSLDLPNEFKSIYLARLVKELSKATLDPRLLLKLMENLPYNAINLFCYRLEPHLGFHCNHYKSLKSSDTVAGSTMSSMVRVPYACGVFNLIALCNNSCDPNAVLFKNVRSPEGLLLSSRRIKEGEEICISYKSHWSRMNYSERQEWFKEHYKFQCECEACSLKLEENHLVDELPPSGDETTNDKMMLRLQGIHDDLEQVVELMEAKDYTEAWNVCVDCVELLSKSQVDKQWRLKVIAEDLLRQIIVQLAMQ